MTFLLCPADLESCEGRRQKSAHRRGWKHSQRDLIGRLFSWSTSFHVWKFQERSLLAFRKWKSYRPTSRYKDSSSYLPIFHHKVRLKGPSMGSNLEGRLLSDPTNKFHWCFVDDITLTITMLAYSDFCPLSNLKLGIKSCFSVLINKIDTSSILDFLASFWATRVWLKHTVLGWCQNESLGSRPWTRGFLLDVFCTAMVPHVPEMQILYGASTIAPIQAIPKRKHMSDSLASGNIWQYLTHHHI